jgi:hypothetical protein
LSGGLLTAPVFVEVIARESDSVTMPTQSILVDVVIPATSGVAFTPGSAKTRPVQAIRSARVIIIAVKNLRDDIEWCTPVADRISFS